MCRDIARTQPQEDREIAKRIAEIRRTWSPQETLRRQRMAQRAQLNLFQILEEKAFQSEMQFS